MAEKRKYGCYLSPPIIDNNSTYVLGKDELMNLTKVAKAWNFTCSFCYKSFPSAQAMGGHQNAHRGERLEEKRLFVKDPIRYRKRAYLRAMQAMEDEYSEARGGDSPAASEMVTHEIASIDSPPNNNFVELIAAAAHGNNNVCQSSNDINSPGFDINGKNLKNFFPVKELSLAENVGVHAEGAKGKAIMGFDFGCYGASSEDLDLTLRL